MGPSSLMLLANVLVVIAAPVLLYVVIRLAVTHALRSVAIWKQDGRFAEALRRRTPGAPGATAADRAG